MEYNANSSDVTWDAFNTSIAVLELYIVMFTVGIAVLGIWGYKEIKNKCIEAVLTEYKSEKRKWDAEYREKQDQSISNDWEGLGYDDI